MVVRSSCFLIIIVAPLLLRLCQSLPAVLGKPGREKIKTRLLPCPAAICPCNSCCQAAFRRRVYLYADGHFTDFALQRSSCGAAAQSSLLTAAISCCCCVICCC